MAADARVGRSRPCDVAASALSSFVATLVGLETILFVAP